MVEKVNLQKEKAKSKAKPRERNRQPTLLRSGVSVPIGSEALWVVQVALGQTASFLIPCLIRYLREAEKEMERINNRRLLHQKPLELPHLHRL